MTESLTPPVSRWRYGLHPQATDMRIRSLGRVFLQLGEALRLEMANASSDGDDLVHLQYYIVTELGPWAVWLSCAREDVADAEEALRDLAPPSGDKAQTDPLAASRRVSGPWRSPWR
jgi:hypothetical protein